MSVFEEQLTRVMWVAVIGMSALLIKVIYDIFIRKNANHDKDEQEKKE